jgi:hypothetical protein
MFNNQVQPHPFSTARRPYGKRKRNASIKDNFDDCSDSDSDSRSTGAISVPGPGAYIKDSSTFGKFNQTKAELS